MKTIRDVLEELLHRIDEANIIIDADDTFDKFEKRIIDLALKEIAEIIEGMRKGYSNEENEKSKNRICYKCELLIHNQAVTNIATLIRSQGKGS